VLTLSEAAEHPHNVEHKTFIEIAGMKQPAPGPRFSRTATATPTPPAHAGQHSREILTDWGFAADDIASLLASGTVKEA